jgi:GWxTD domain-containing protein
MSSIFYKNTLEVTPNPSMVFSNTKPVMFYYMELYNLQSGEVKSNFKMEKLLFNSSGNMIYNKSKKVSSAQSSFVEFGVLNLTKYPTDSYNFVVTLVDTVLNKALVSNKKFYLYNPDVVDTFTNKYRNTDFLSSEFGVYTEEECDYMFNVAKYIATEPEKKQYASLDSLDTKREFLFNFWKLRDYEPQTARNEYKDDYMERAAYAEKYFGNRYRAGYKSDRGRVYLLYGEPDQRDRFPNERFLKPYEIWTYNGIEGGVEFVFADMTGFSNYELVHSTKRGELRDDDWSRRIATN